MHPALVLVLELCEDAFLDAEPRAVERAKLFSATDTREVLDGPCGPAVEEQHEAWELLDPDTEHPHLADAIGHSVHPSVSGSLKTNMPGLMRMRTLLARCQHV